jgi:hypothetical protein
VRLEGINRSQGSLIDGQLRRSYHSDDIIFHLSVVNKNLVLDTPKFFDKAGKVFITPKVHGIGKLQYVIEFSNSYIPIIVLVNCSNNFENFDKFLFTSREYSYNLFLT